jgi:hypothetical protein
VDGIGQIADSISAELKQRLPHQRKTQRGKLALLVATMLDVRSANLMDVAAGLPLEADRTDMRYQWITRLLGNPLVISDEIMEPFAREVLEQAVGETKPVVLIMDQSKLSDRHQVLMLALRYGERALPLAWRVEATEGAIGFATQKALLEAVAPWIPAGATVRLMGDRFYGTADLIGWCQERDWGYRLRLKGNLVVFDSTGKTTTGACLGEKLFYLEDVALTGKRARPHIGILHDPGHAEPPAFARASSGSSPCPNRPATCELLNTVSVGGSNRCSRTSNRAASGLRIPRSATPTGSIACSSSCLWRSTGRCPPACGMPFIIQLQAKKKLSRSAQKGGAQQDLVVHPRAPSHHQAHAFVLAASATLGGTPELIDGQVPEPNYQQFTGNNITL